MTTLQFRESQPEFHAVVDKLLSMTVREEEIQAELGPLNDKIRERGGYAFPYSRPKTPHPKAISEKAAELLGEHLPEQPEPEEPPHGDAEIERAQDLARELEALQEARELLLPVWHRQRTEASRAYCDEIRDQYAVVAAQYLKALNELADAATAHKAFLDGVFAQGVEIAHLRHVPDEILGVDSKTAASMFRAIICDFKHFLGDGK